MSVDLSGLKIGFLGSGAMAEALACGFIKGGVVQGDQIFCTDVNPARIDVFKTFGANGVDSNPEVVKAADVVFVCTKPQYVGTVLQEVQPHVKADKLIVSIAAGVTTAQMLQCLGEDARVVRVMPNTPCLVGETASAMCLAGKAAQRDQAVVEALFKAVGKIFTLDEKLFSAVTGLSGSGPAYVFVMIEALADGGVKAGLPRDIAQQLAAQTVLGGAKMVLETGKHPGQLKDMVTSPAGTTIAGVHELEKAGVRSALINAVSAASARANELSRL